MATTSYEKLLKQVELLQVRAKEVRQQEVVEIVARIKKAVAVYGLTTADLFPDLPRAKSSKSSNAKSKSGAADQVRKTYSDGKGGVWGGMGKRPRWLAEALASGRNLSDFLNDSSKPPAETPVKTAPQQQTSAKSVVKKKDVKHKAGSRATYADGSGNTWTGRGRKPGWMVAALANGKTIEDLIAQS